MNVRHQTPENRAEDYFIHIINTFAAVYLNSMIYNILKAIHSRVSAAIMLDRIDFLDQKFLSGDKDYLENMRKFYLQVQHFEPRLKSEMLSNLEHAVSMNDADRLYALSGVIRQEFDQLYRANQPFKKAKRLIIVALSIAFIIACAFSVAPLRKRYKLETEQYTSAANEKKFKQVIFDDIQRLKKAIDRFYADNGSYPKSSGGFDAVISNYGESKKDWIPGLAPKYIDRLPNDPRRSSEGSNQYMYKSDGVEFKLLAHHPLGMTEVVADHPELVDPIRPSWAFGYWTEGAKNW